MNRTKIEYLTHTWNPIAMRCSRVSEGCRRCWHLSMADRLAQNPTLSDDRRQAYGGGAPVLFMDELTAPLRIRKPAVIGVQFMGDLFHSNVSSDFILRVWLAMLNAPQHTFIVLTKRSSRAQMLLDEWMHSAMRLASCLREEVPWPLPNVIVGVSIEDQATADKRIPLLIQTPAACRVVSLEPMLEPVELRRAFGTEGPRQTYIEQLDWVIMGCESGPGARPMQIEWARSIKAQCVAAGIPLFYKQGPGDDGVVCGMPMLDGHIWAQKPEREQP